VVLMRYGRYTIALAFQADLGTDRTGRRASIACNGVVLWLSLAFALGLIGNRTAQQWHPVICMARHGSRALHIILERKTGAGGMDLMVWMGRDKVK